MHGNLLTALPASMGNLHNLKAFSAAGNLLTAVPETLGSLRSLTSLELAGNRLETLPETIGNLGTAHDCQNIIRHRNLRPEDVVCTASRYMDTSMRC